MSSLISIGLSGLSASQAALSVTSNNIANAATSGYSRQQVLQAAGPSHNIGAGFLGTGTTISDVRRIYSAYLDNQLQTATSLQADSVAFQDQVTAVDKLLADRDTGISAVLTSFSRRCKRQRPSQGCCLTAVVAHSGPDLEQPLQLCRHSNESAERCNQLAA